MEKTIKEIEQIYKARRDEMRAGYKIKTAQAFISYQEQLSDLKRKENEEMLNLARSEAEEIALHRELMLEQGGSGIDDSPEEL